MPEGASAHATNCSAQRARRESGLISGEADARCNLAATPTGTSGGAAMRATPFWEARIARVIAPI